VNRKNTKTIGRQTWGSCRKTTLQVCQWRTDACRRMVLMALRTKVHKIRE